MLGESVSKEREGRLFVFLVTNSYRGYQVYSSHGALKAAGLARPLRAAILSLGSRAALLECRELERKRTLI